MKDKEYCGWAGVSESMKKYHDSEWGRPTHDERRLFEMLMLEGQQAGLSWLTILNKRESYRKAYDDFDPKKIAKYGDAKVAELLKNPGVIRNRLKVKAVIANAKAYLELCKEFGSLDAYIWGFVDGKAIVNRRKKMSDIPACTPLSDAISKDLKRRGFKFVGSTIVYAYLQSVGVVDDHIQACPAHTDNR